jgi:CRISPR system Cascade subunit CasD
MLAAACGIDKNNDQEEEQWLKDVATLSMTTLLFKRGSRLTDFHTVGANYDRENPWKKKMTPLSAEGKTKPDPVVTQRDYLTDSIFGVMFTGEDTSIDKLAAGLLNPVWGIWLGRKSCIPTEPVFAGLFASKEEAISALKERYHRSLSRVNDTHFDATDIICVYETQDNAMDMIRDIPISFKQRKFYARTIAEGYVSSDANL